MLTRALLSGVQRSLAAALARDPLTARRLAKLGRQGDPDPGPRAAMALYLLPGTQGIELLATSDQLPDCTLSAPQHTAGAADGQRPAPTLLQSRTCSSAATARYWFNLQECPGRFAVWTAKPNCHAGSARWPATR